MKVNNLNLFIEIKDSIISHFGKKPKKGGSPPIENRLINKINLMILLEVNNEKVWLILKSLCLLNVKIIKILKKQ